MFKPLLAGSNTSRVKAHNLQAILLNLLHNGLASRVQLAQHTNLSKTTISNLVAELMEQGIVVEEEADARHADRRRRVGRPRQMLRLVPDARFVAGVHVGIGLVRVAVANLHAQIIHSCITTFDLSADADSVLQQITAQVQQTIDESGVGRRWVLGIGVGASGLVNTDTGTNLLAPRLGWRHVPIRQVLQERLEIPVCVDNNVRAMALGEAYFGGGKGVNNQAFIYGRVGVGAGFVVQGRLFRGGGAGAGEIGHTIVLPHGGERCSCGQRGCLETLVSEPVLLREARRRAAQAPAGILAAQLARGGESPIAALFAAARGGDELATGLLHERADYLGLALANLVNVLNPELIILGGMFAQGYDLIGPRAAATMRRLAFGGLGDNVRVESTRSGWRAGVVGAAALALMHQFYEAE